MIIKNETDAERFIEFEGVCGVAGQYCCRSCQVHGAHVAISGAGEEPFAYGASPELVHYLEGHEPTALPAVVDRNVELAMVA